MRTFKCKWCDNIKVTVDNISEEPCEICQKGIMEEMHNDDPKAEEFIIVRMKQQIKLLGNNKTWEVIERFGKIETRIAYRKYFFLAGGQVPEFEIKERI